MKINNDKSQVPGGISIELVESIKKFRDERNWKQFHNPKDLAISISLEAAELLENFQWSGTEIEPNGKLQNVKDELADVLIYCISMADRLDIKLETIIREKLEENAKKYEVSKAYGSAKKYTELEDL